MSAAGEAVVVFDHATVVVGEGSARRAIVEDLELAIARGERLVLLGRSGSGKTTALRLVNALTRPTSGEVRVEGRSTRAWDPVRLRRRIGYVIQEVGLLPHRDVRDNVALVPRLEGWDAPRIEARVAEVLSLVGLDVREVGGRFPNELSGGQRQRVGVARALAADPPIVLLDEPFGAVDPVLRLELQRVLVELATRLDKTLLLVTHDVREAFAIGTRIALLRDGRLVVTGTPAEIARSDDPEARAFVASMAPPSSPELGAAEPT